MDSAVNHLSDNQHLKQWRELPTQPAESGELQRVEFSWVGRSDHAFMRQTRSTQCWYQPLRWRHSMMYSAGIRHCWKTCLTPVRLTKSRRWLAALSLTKCYQLDPAPAWLVKDMRWLLSPFITVLFSKSLSTGSIPEEFKQAIIRRFCPLRKKAGQAWYQLFKELRASL